MRRGGRLGLDARLKGSPIAYNGYSNDRGDLHERYEPVQKRVLIGPSFQAIFERRNLPETLISTARKRLRRPSEALSSPTSFLSAFLDNLHCLVDVRDLQANEVDFRAFPHTAPTSGV
jgi:hypothetical protein